MLITAGKFYKTRSGSLAYIAATHNPFLPIDEQGRAIGWMKLGDGEGFEVLSWNIDGAYGKSSYYDSPVDLIEETEAPQ